MRRTIILAVMVLALSVALCVASTLSVGGAVARTEELRRAAERAARLGDTAGALAKTRAMAEGWQKDSRWLELMTSHDALADVRGGIADALICLENNDRPEFLRAVAAISAALEHLRDTEAMRLMNLF